MLASLTDDSKKLGFYGLADWQVLKVRKFPLYTFLVKLIPKFKVIDTNPSASLTGQLTDVTQVDKFELTTEEYAQRRDTVLAYKQRNKVGRFAEKEDSAEAEVAPESVNIPVGSRCEIESLEPGLSKRGTVRFVGETKFNKGVWVGVEYDEPLGKNDGSYVISEFIKGRQLICRYLLQSARREVFYMCA